MRIALSGAGGTGKGTLAKLIAAKYDLAYLESPGEPIGRSLGMENYKDSDQMTQMALQHGYLFGIIWQEKGCIAAGKGYVSERTPLDCIPYYQDKELPHASRYGLIAMEHAKVYDHVFYLPAEYTAKDIAQATWKERGELARQKTDRLMWATVQSTILPEKRTILSGTVQQRMEQVEKVLDDLAAPHSALAFPA
jgi:hypothetical protein